MKCSTHCFASRYAVQPRKTAIENHDNGEHKK